MQVARCNHLSIEDWSLFDARVGAPTFFARPAWALSLQAAFPDRYPAPLRITLSDGSTVIVPLMESKTRIFGMRRLTGMPLRTYTAFVGEDGKAAGAAQSEAAARYVLERCGDGVEIVPWPLGHLPEPIEQSPPTPEAAVIDLSAGLEACLKAMDGTARRMARQAQRRGVTCAVETGAGVAAIYFGMLEESAHRWGRAAPTIPKVLIDEAVRRGGADVEIWIARYEGAHIAGGIAVYGNEEASFWSAAMRADFGTLRPSNLLNTCMIERAIARKCRWFNLGESEGLPGVKRFKESLGAAPLRYPILRRESARLRAYRSAGDALRAILRRSAAQPPDPGEGDGDGDASVPVRDRSSDGLGEAAAPPMTE